MTWYKPEPIMLIGLGIFHILWVYNSYRIWFQTEAEYKKNLEETNKIPSWFPLREYFIDNLNNKEGWMRQMKFVSVAGISFLILLDILLLAATIFGK